MEDYSLLRSIRNRKRKRAFFHESLLEEGTAQADVMGDNFDLLTNLVGVAGILSSKPRKPRVADRDRDARKLRWEDLFYRSSEEEFKEKMRVSRATFDFLVQTMWDDLILVPTNWKPNPTTPDRQLALTL